MRCYGVAVLAGVGFSLLGGLPGAAQAQNQVPFRATWTALDTPVTQTCPGLVCFANTGRGIATQLGAFTSTGTVVATALSVPAPGQLALSTAETYVLTAANGDTVELTNTATGIDDLLTGRTSVSGTWVITGGTGRFSGAQGSGTTRGTAQVGPGFTLRGIFTLVGTVSAPGARR